MLHSAVRLGDDFWTVLHNTGVVVRTGVVYIMYKGVVNIATGNVNNAVASVNRYHISNNALIVLHLLG